MRREEKILLNADNLWYAGEGMLGPLFAVFSQRIGGNILDITWAWATYLVVTGIFAMVFGQISDKPGRTEKLLVGGYALNAILTFCYLFVSSPFQLLLVQAGLGIAVAMATPTWNVLYSKYRDTRHSGYVWGLADGTASIVTGLAFVVGGLIVNYFSFPILFVVMGMIQVLATIYLAQILKNKL